MKLEFVNIFLFIFATSLFAQEEQVFTFYPEKPRYGDSVKIFYNPKAKKALIKDPRKVELCLSLQIYPIERSEVMCDGGGKWIGEIKLDSTFPPYFKISFKSGDKWDNNDGNQWGIMIYKNQKTPEKEAHIWKGDSYYGSDYNPSQYDSLVLNEYEKEDYFYPDDFDTKITLWSFKMKRSKSPDSIKTIILAEIKKLYLQGPENNEVLRKVQWAYRMINDYKNAEEIKQKRIIIDPKGKMAINNIFESIKEEKNIEVRISLYEKFIIDYPKNSLVYDALDELFQLYLGKNDTNKSYEIGNKKLAFPYPCKSFIYSYIAESFAQKRIYLKEAREYVQKSIELEGNEPAFVNQIPSDSGCSWKIRNMPEDDTQKEFKRKKWLLRYRAGFVYFNSDKYSDAEKYFTQALEQKSDDFNTMKYLAKTYIKLDKIDPAYTLLDSLLIKRPSDSTLINDYRQIFIKKNGSENGLKDRFEALNLSDMMVSRFTGNDLNEKLNKYNRNHYLNLSEKIIKDRLNIDAPGFNLVSSQNQPIMRDNYKNKVLILNFWATWCRPCILELPYLQKIYEYFEKDKDVKFLVINIAEGINETSEKAKNFIAENKYTFPFAYDKDNIVSTSFGIHSIPMTILIGRNGKIQYRNEGFNSDEDFESKLKLQIFSLLNEK